MWGYHLKQRGKWWHYYRAVPKRFQDVDNRSFICFSLKTSDFREAKLKAILGLVKEPQISMCKLSAPYGQAGMIKNKMEQNTPLNNHAPCPKNSENGHELSMNVAERFASTL